MNWRADRRRQRALWRDLAAEHCQAEGITLRQLWWHEVGALLSLGAGALVFVAIAAMVGGR